MVKRNVSNDDPTPTVFLPTWRFELVKGVDTVRTSNDLASLASQVITHLGLLLRDKVSEQRRRVGRLEPDFYTEEDYRVSEDADLNPPVGGAEAPRIFEIVAGSGSPVVKTREVPVKEIKAAADGQYDIYDEAVDAMNEFNKHDLGEILFNLRKAAIDSGKGRPAVGEKLDMDMFDRAFSRQMGGDRSTRLDGLRGIDLSR